MSNIQSMFPGFELDQAQKDAEVAADMLHDLLEAFPEFTIDGENVSLTLEGITDVITVSYDTDEHNSIVFRAVYTTFCPTQETSSNYHDNPFDALNELSELYKADREKLNAERTVRANTRRLRSRRKPNLVSVS